MSNFVLKVKTKSGHHVVSNLTATETVGKLKTQIAELTSIPVDSLSILGGFPPKPLNLTVNDENLATAGIRSGDTLIVEARQGNVISNTATPDSKRIEEVRNESNKPIEEDRLAADVIDGLNSEGILLKQVVPSDNSCLFTSIGFALNGRVDTEVGTYMREIIAQHVSNDKESFNEAILGKPNQDYCDWIRKSSSWGGAIEVSILSTYYGVEIAVVDITNALINRFGEDKEFAMRIFLLFDGIHYDPLYLESFTGGSLKTMFHIDDGAAFKQAEQLAVEAKSSRQFTDVNKFTLKCMQCDVHLVGQVEAQAHAKSTGHTNFGEV